MNELALFAGAGGGILGGKLLGWKTVCAVEWEPHPISILIQRQNEGVLPPFPIWDDIRTFDGIPWRGLVDVVSGGFPCQDISSAGKGAGIDGGRSSMWYHMLRVIVEVQPKFCFIENSPHLITKGLVTVLQGLAEAGYDAVWDVISAEDCGANHERKRMWIVATNSNSINESLRGDCKGGSEGVLKWENDTNGSEYFGLQGYNFTTRKTTGNASNPYLPQCKGGWLSCGGEEEHPNPGLGTWWETSPTVYRMDDGVAFGMDRLKAIGNGQVPIVAATAWKQLIKAMYEEMNQ